MAWEGKRLQSLSGNNTTASYTYDEQGVRSSKTVNGVTTTFHYNGSLLMAQVQGSGSSQVKQLYSYDANGDVISVNYNGTEYYYLRNGQTDIVGLMDGSGTRVVEYTYDAWGKLISTTGTLATSLGADNPFRYRGYYYDTETGLYYLMTRYYDPEVCRFISADVYMTTGQGVLGGNMFAYCGNNPAIRYDDQGQVWETIFDIFSLGMSIVEVACNPTDPWAWAGLAGDVIDLVPFVTGVGEVTRAVRTTKKAIEYTDDAIDAAKATYKAADAASNIRKATGTYEILYESGKNYVGKGGLKRAIQSATEHAKPSRLNDFVGDQVTSIRWKSAPSSKAAFIEEALMQMKRGVNNSTTYNRIWSPGKKYMKAMVK